MIQMDFLQELGLKLSELALKNTASFVLDKIKTVNVTNDFEKSKATYDEIINKLLEEREEAIRIAQAYRNELEKIEISDKDIEHLHETISRILTTLKTIQTIQSNQADNICSKEQGAALEKQFQFFEQIKEFVSTDTLKTMQLIGFNYKTAIGEPLTQVTKEFLLSKLSVNQENIAFQKMLTPELLEVLKNNTSTTNLIKLTKELGKAN